MHPSLDRRRWILATFGSATLAGCATISDGVSSVTSSLGLGGSSSSAPAPAPATGRQVGVPATAAHTASIRAAFNGDAAARAEVVKMGYRSPQQVVGGLNKIVQNSPGGAVKAANFRPESRHNNGLDGASLTLYYGPSAANPTWWVDIKVYADANLNTVVEGVYKLANTPRGASGEGYDLMQALRNNIDVSKFDDRLPPALLFRGHFAGF